MQTRTFSENAEHIHRAIDVVVVFISFLMYIVRTHVVIVFVCRAERGKGLNRGSDDDDGCGVLFTIRKRCEMFAQTVDRPFVVCPRNRLVCVVSSALCLRFARVTSAFCDMCGWRVVCSPCNPQLRPVHGY